MGFNYFTFADNVSDSLYVNLNTLAAGNATLNIWTNSTAELNKRWQTGGDPHLEQEIDQIHDKKSLKDFFNNHMSDSSEIDKFCMSFITKLYGKLSQYYDSTDGPIQSSTLQQFQNLIAAKLQIETSTGQTKEKSQASILQQVISSTQPISDLGNAVIGILTSIASLSSQTFV